VQHLEGKGKWAGVACLRTILLNCIKFSINNCISYATYCRCNGYCNNLLVTAICTAMRYSNNNIGTSMCRHCSEPYPASLMVCIGWLIVSWSSASMSRRFWGVWVLLKYLGTSAQINTSCYCNIGKNIEIPIVCWGCNGYSNRILAIYCISRCKHLPSFRAPGGVTRQQCMKWKIIRCSLSFFYSPSQALGLCTVGSGWKARPPMTGVIQDQVRLSGHRSES